MSEGAADRDVSEIRAEIRDFRNATTASLNAVREDFSDLRTNVDRGFTEMRSKLDATASGQQTIADLIYRCSAFSSTRRTSPFPEHPECAQLFRLAE